MAPVGPTAQVLTEAERLVLAAAAQGVRASVLRLSGLYGPGRIGIFDRVRTGALALGPGDDTWMNFCHLDDAVAFVLGALERAPAGAILHGSDARPATRREVVEWIAARLGIAPARTRHAAVGPHRRVLSVRTRTLLGLELRWPSFAQGLEPLVPAPET